MTTKDELERAVIDAARSWHATDERWEKHVEHVLDNAVAALEAHEQAQRADEMVWVTRTWADVRPGDTIRPPGNTLAAATVHSAIKLNWHVDPRSGKYEAIPLEYSVIRARFTKDTPPRDFNPDALVEIFLSRQEVTAIEMLGWENRVLVTG